MDDEPRRLAFILAGIITADLWACPYFEDKERAELFRCRLPDPAKQVDQAILKRFDSRCCDIGRLTGDQFVRAEVRSDHRPAIQTNEGQLAIDMDATPAGQAPPYSLVLRNTLAHAVDKLFRELPVGLGLLAAAGLAA